MDEAEWWACADPDRMLKFLGRKYSARKLRLFAVACCRRFWFLLGKTSRRAVEVAEQFADGGAGLQELDEAGDLAGGRERVSNRESPAVSATFHDAFKAARGASAYAAGWAVASVTPMREWEAAFGAECARHAGLLREIVGNPFRPASVAPRVLAWEGGTVVRIGQGIYEGNRFQDLPVLADALEEAGCDDSDLLAHCRESGEHVRGCWVVDLLVGRE